MTSQKRHPVKKPPCISCIKLPQFFKVFKSCVFKLEISDYTLVWSVTYANSIWNQNLPVIPCLFAKPHEKAHEKELNAHSQNVHCPTGWAIILVHQNLAKSNMIPQIILREGFKKKNMFFIHILWISVLPHRQILS